MILQIKTLLWLLAVTFYPTVLWSAEIVIIAMDDAVAFLPESVALEGGETADLVIEGDTKDQLSEWIHVRGNGVVALQGQQLLAQKRGQSQLSVIRGDRVFSLPIEVLSDAPQLVAPKSAASTMLGQDQSDKTDASIAEDPAVVSPSASESIEQPSSPVLSISAQDLADSAPEDATAAPTRETSTPGVDHQLQVESHIHRDFQLLAMDDRSDPGDRAIYPAGDIQIQIPSLGLTRQTTQRGELALTLPVQGRVMVFTSDAKGRFMNAQSEFDLGKSQDARLRMNVMRQFHFDVMTSITGTVQDSGKGSLCVKSAKSEDNIINHFTLHAAADGPFYFNQLGLIDPSVGELGRNGRVCFFNVEEGLTSLDFKRGEEVIYTRPYQIYASYHQEDDVQLERETAFAGKFAIQPAFETFLQKPQVGWHDVNGSIDALPFGIYSTVRSDNFGSFVMQDYWADAKRPEQYLYVDEADLSPTIFRLSTAAGVTPLLPIFPRGFFEDVAIEYGLVLDERNGSVMAHFQLRRGIASDAVAGPIDLRLRHVDGQEIPSLKFATSRQESALFLNVLPGYYQLFALDGNERLLGVEGVFVYSGTVSSVSFGAGYEEQIPGQD